MLDQKTFLQGINYLKANYLKWDFDLNNDLMLKVWYKKFSVLENNEYIALIDKYTDNNQWPPNSPTDILQLLKSSFDDGENAWNWVESLAKQFPLDNEFYKPKFYQELKKDSLAYELFEKLDCEILFTSQEEDKFIFQAGKVGYIGFGKGYRKDKFIKWYNGMSKPKEVLRIGSSNLLLK